MPGFAEQFAEAVHGAGGRALEAGGAVRDRLLSRPHRDVDLEVYGLEAPELEAVIARFGRVRRVGARLGVYVLKGVEVALPQGPDGVEDPRLTPERAARRRDLTINALLRDPRTGEILDFHHGREDLARRRLRHVDPDTFAEDPLRVLRVARLHAELGFRIDPATAALCRRLSLHGVAWERIGQELERWLLGASRPGRGMDGLLYTGAERHFPFLAALLGCPVAGTGAGADAWARTRAVLDAAARRRVEERERDWPLMLAALLQSLGRPDATFRHPGRAPTAPGHAAVAAGKAALWLRGVDRGQRRARTVRALLREQGAVNALAAARAGRPDYRRLACRVDTDLLLRLAEALHEAEAPGSSGYPAGEQARAIWSAEGLLGRAPEPLLAGRDLQALGVPAGPGLGRWLETAFEAQLDGQFASREAGLAWLRDRLEEGGPPERPSEA
ncbi:CCA tRNA nucleotidyltransferase [Thiohalorhabdus methylotrophus]|uniref:CCA tRNA nucleotidyltransferase n=1 Tax=Thiohalorhabdus methylotrophus TaxID=3242694 RepID=A0ABV4TRM8_9GAMM